MTPIHEISLEGIQNQIFMKREDLLAFSFGGNKVRIAKEFFDDMKKIGKDCMVGYGSARSNLSRALANFSSSRGVECYIVSPADMDGIRIETANSKIGQVCKANFRYCMKENVAETVEAVLEECCMKGMKPYYIYGDKYGHGNEAVPVRAYVEVYKEIKRQENSLGIKFDYIFLATGTGMTQSGLIAGQREEDGCECIIGISVARQKEIDCKTIQKYIEAYENSLLGMFEINILDNYLAGGYGLWNESIKKTIYMMMEKNGVPLDTTYTGKAFWGMLEYLKRENIKNKNVLFVHTGGIPLFFDDLNTFK